MVVDAWVSKLNAARESSQFELVQDDAHSVHDNEGSLIRYVCKWDIEGLKDKVIKNLKFNNVSCQVNNYCPSITSSIDFHCINPHNYGRPYRRFWLVTHDRDRYVNSDNELGNIRRVNSFIWGIKWPKKYDSNKPFIPIKWTTKNLAKVDAAGNLLSYYSRTPMFVARDQITKNKNTEDDKDQAENDGYLFVWIYRVTHQLTRKPQNLDESYKDWEKNQNNKIESDHLIDENLVESAIPDFNKRREREKIEEKIKKKKRKKKY